VSTPFDKKVLVFYYLLKVFKKFYLKEQHQHT
jgi:hypothetical protein